MLAIAENDPITAKELIRCSMFDFNIHILALKKKADLLKQQQA